MRSVALFFCLIFFALTAEADTLTCETLKMRVDAKLQTKGVPSYTLEIVPVKGQNSPNAISGVPATNAINGKQVGTCDGGTKRLIYTRGN